MIVFTGVGWGAVSSPSVLTDVKTSSTAVQTVAKLSAVTTECKQRQRQNNTSYNTTTTKLHDSINNYKKKLTTTTFIQGTTRTTISLR